jgi:hypothetical protein
MFRALEQAVGAILMLLVLADVFLTVLYARAGFGIISQQLATLTWRFFRAIPMTKHRAALLSYCGPTILVLLVLIWSVLLAVGAGLIIHPELGSGIGNSSGDTPKDFITALFIGGSSLSIVGSSNFAPHSAAMKMLFLLNAIFGTSVISLTLTYLMQVYSALRERNTFGLKLHAASGETGDAAKLLARLFPDDQFSSGYNNLSEFAAEMARMKEAHHFYPVLFYFRFEQSYYAVSRTTLLVLDVVALIKAAFPDETAGWAKKSAAVEQLSSVSLMLLSTLQRTFIRRSPERQREHTARNAEDWRLRYSAALHELRRGGLTVVENDVRGVEAYIDMRSGWDPLIASLAPTMAYSMDEIDPAIHAAPSTGGGPST